MKSKKNTKTTKASVKSTKGSSKISPKGSPKVAPKKTPSPVPVALPERVPPLKKAITRSGGLTPIQEYYIKGMYTQKEPREISVDLGVSVGVVNKYISTLKSESAPQGRVNSLMQRPARGVIALTESASMRADELKGSENIITQADINKAAAAGDYALASRLVEMREKRTRDKDSLVRARYGDRFHFIRKPGDEPMIDGK